MSSSVTFKTIWCAASLFTDAKVGVFTHPHDSSLLQNRCFLYHLIGNKTGEWKVPVGGMGTVRPSWSGQHAKQALTC
jgi:hypothetical protein